MTHNELLAKIEHYNYMEARDLIKALSAVVELHKPFLYPEDDCIYCEEDSQPYPCPTIQAIQEQLK